MVLASAGSKWRSFKTALTKKFILPYKDDPKALETPPKVYEFIQKDQWTTFVATRLTDDFLVFMLNTSGG